jgi:TolA-binding protein
MSCDLRWQVDAVEEGRLSSSDASFKRHLRACEECRGQLASNDELRARLRSLPERSPAELGLRRLRARVLREAAGAGAGAAPPRLALVGAAMAAILVCLAVGVGVRRLALRPRPSADVGWAGAVMAAEGARWLQARAGNVERVSLLDGEIRIVVRKQAPDERFLVVLPDGELEVRGTTFDVIVRSGTTRHVHVVEGVVDVRVPAGSGTDGRGLTLTVGQTWDAAERATRVDSPGRVDPGWAPAAPTATPSPATPSPFAAPSSPSSPGTAAARSGAARAPEAQKPAVPSIDSNGATVADDWMPDYEAAMGLYRSGRFGQAAEAFDRFALAHPGASTIDDALFLQAAALARAGRGDAAAIVAEHQIERFPDSFHHKDASILVARAARARGDCEAARRALAPWLTRHDADASRELGSCSP